jgi:lytic cellulose monooxygenase (C1-hydroxylating)
LSVNSKDMGSLFGLRAPNNNNPVQDVMSNDMICGRVASSSRDVITIAPGDKIGSWWQHVIGGPQFANDPDNPIAPSHKGPITAWLAKVDSASSTGVSGLNWFKVAEDGYDVASNQWAVDKMIAGKGWSYFNMPKCIAPGEYLLRIELLALHSATQQRGAQFYISCANIKVTGSGTFSPSQTVKFPGAYQQNDPVILTSIYSKGGKTDNNGKPYIPAGPRAITC